MPSVPVTSNRGIANVDPEVQGQFRASTPRDFIGPAVTQFGNRVSQAVDEIDQIEATYDEADATRIANEYREFERERLRTGENAYLSTKGFAAGNGQEGVVTELQDFSEGLLGSARSERAQQMARRALNERMNTSQTTIANHALTEMQVAREEQSQARISGAITDAIDARGTEQFAVNLALAQQELGDQAVRQGWSSEKLADEDARLVSNAYARTALAIDAEDGNPTRALEFVESNADLINPEDEAKLITQLSPRVDQAWAGELFDEGVFDQYLPETPELPETESVAGEPVADGVAVINELFPNAIVTSGHRPADHPLSRANPTSYHTKTHAAVDTARIPGMTFEQYVAKIEDAGYTVIEAIDEYANPSPHATGGHWHVVIGGAGEPGEPGVAADPRLNSRLMRQAVDAYITANPGISERRQQALYAEADRRVSQGRADRAQSEAEADRRLQDWLMQNKPGDDDLTSLQDIPASILSGISPQANAALSQRVQSTRTRIQGERQQEAEETALFKLYQMSDAELSTANLDQYIGVVDRMRLGPWYRRQQAARASIEGSGSAPLSRDRVNRMLDRIGKDFGASRSVIPGNKASSDERTRWIAAGQYVENVFSDRTDDQITEEELRTAVITGLQQGEIQGSGWSFGIGLDVFRASSTRAEAPAGSQFAISQIDPDLVDDIRFNLQQSGVEEPSDTLIWEAYQMGLARGEF